MSEEVSRLVKSVVSSKGEIRFRSSRDTPYVFIRG